MSDRRWTLREVSLLVDPYTAEIARLRAELEQKTAEATSAWKMVDELKTPDGWDEAVDRLVAEKAALRAERDLLGDAARRFERERNEARHQLAQEQQAHAATKEKLYSGWEINGKPWTWQQMYERECQGRLRAQDKAIILSDLTRCEHGRHEGDDCFECGGPSHGNPYLPKDRIIGFTLGAAWCYYIPTRSEHKADPEHNNVIKVAPTAPERSASDK